MLLLRTHGGHQEARKDIFPTFTNVDNYSLRSSLWETSALVSRKRSELYPPGFFGFPSPLYFYLGKWWEIYGDFFSEKSIGRLQKSMGIPSGNLLQFAIENDHRNSGHFPMKNGDFPCFFVCLPGRVPSPCHHWIPRHPSRLSFFSSAPGDSPHLKRWGKKPSSIP